MDDYEHRERRHRENLARRSEDALLSLLGYKEHEGLWLSPEGLVLEGREEALEEACLEVELGLVTITRPPKVG
jgi:hypothetical protein